MNRKFITLVALALVSGTAAAQVQTYPTKPVRVVIPWPAGGSNDAAGRIVMQRVAVTMGKQFVVDNRAGAAGSIGADQVAKAPADGHTLMVHSTTHLANAHIYDKKLPYDTLKDFAPVAMIAGQPSVLVVHPSLQTRTAKDFIALAKARPGQINYASSGSGSTTHLAMALLSAMTDIKLVHVPYKGGPQEVTSLVSGETGAAVSTIATVITHVNMGRLRALAVASAQRSPTMPDVPTIAESGVPGYEWKGWIAAFAPAGTPERIIDRLNAEIAQALRRPEIADALSKQGLEPWIMTLEALSARINSDYEKYGKVIRLTGAKID